MGKRKSKGQKMIYKFN